MTIHPRLTLNALEKIRMSRSRERILANLDEMYREAFERAKASGDDSQMATLDFAYRREQLTSRSCSMSATRSKSAERAATDKPASSRISAGLHRLTVVARSATPRSRARAPRG